MSKDYCLVFEDINNKVKKNNKLKRRNIKRLFSVAVLSILIVCIINMLTLKIDLFDSYLLIVPLLIFVYYNVFNHRLKHYSFIEEFLLIVTLGGYILLLTIHKFVVNDYVILILNIFALLSLIFIIRSIVEIFYIGLIKNNVDIVTNKMYGKFFIDDDKEKQKSDGEKLLKTIEKNFYSISSWFSSSSEKTVLRNLKSIRENLLSVYKRVVRIKANKCGIDIKKIENIEKTLVKYDKILLDNHLSTDENAVIDDYLNYKVKKLDFLLEQNLYKDYETAQIKYLFSDLENIIQEGKVLCFNSGLSYFSTMLRKKIKDSDSKDCFETLELSLYSSIYILRKYLDNISTIAGKFVLQLICKNYKKLAEYIDTEKLNSQLFLLIKLLRSKEKAESTMRIFYSFLSDVMKSFDNFDDRVDFLQTVIFSFDENDEDISPLVFDDLKDLFDEEDTNDDTVIDIYTKVHLSFRSKVYNRNIKRIKDIIVYNKPLKDENEVIDNLTYLFANQIDFAQYFFRMIKDDLDNGVYKYTDFILKKDSRLIKLEENIISTISMYKKLNDIVPIMIQLNRKIVSYKASENVKREMLSFYKKTIDILSNHCNMTNDMGVKDDSLDRIRLFANDNLYNDNFRYTVGKLHVLGIKSLESHEVDLQKSVSNNFGWTLYDGFKSSNVQENSKNIGFQKLIDYFKKACRMTDVYVSRFIGTAVIINYVQSLLSLNKNESKQLVKREINLLISDKTYSKILIESVELKSVVINEYFKEYENFATDTLKRLKQQLNNQV